MRYLVVAFFVILSVGCRKKDSPKSPEQARLVHPARSSECTTGTDVFGNDNVSEVEFSWQKANYTTQYQLRVTNHLTGVTQTVNTSDTKANLTLVKGELYSWLIRSSNSDTDTQVTSEVWNFYNAGNESFYAPFPATIVNPKPASKVFKDINNEIELSWEGADIDNDIVEYELFFSTSTPPSTMVATLNVATSSDKVSVVSGTTYYWKVISKDAEGNISDSGIYSFQVL